MILLYIYLIVGIIDTIMGNWWFPGKEGIVKDHSGSFRLYKYNRVMLIPFKMWDDTLDNSKRGCIGDFTSYTDAHQFNTLEDAKEFLTSERKKILNECLKCTEVYSTRGVDKEKDVTALEDLRKDETDPEILRVYDSIIERLKN